MQLRAAVLAGTDVVALSVWPEDDERRDGAGCRGLPVETRCVDQALAATLEDLVARHGTDPSTATPVGPHEWAAFEVLRWLVNRAQRHHRRP